MWEALYNSAWHQPISFWILQVGFLALVLRRPLADRRTARFVLLGLLVTALDAGLTQLRSPVPAAWQTAVAIGFVIMGDWRYWIVFVRVSRPGVSWRRAFAEGAAFALIVPLGVLLPQRLGWIPGGRPMFLTYELCAFVLALVLAWSRRCWRHPLVVFWLVVYALWALSDFVILWRGDVGFLLRLVPNTLYYGAFWPLVYALALESQSQHKESSR